MTSSLLASRLHPSPAQPVSSKRQLTPARVRLLARVGVRAIPRPPPSRGRRLFRSWDEPIPP